MTHCCEEIDGRFPIKRAGAILTLLASAILTLHSPVARAAPPIVPTSEATSQPIALAFRSGPILGYAGADFLTVACRTSKDAVVTLEIDGRSFKSEPGTIHDFKVTGLKPAAEYPYSLSAEAGSERAKAGPYKTHTLPSGAQITFSLFGDNRSNPDTWAKVAECVRKAKPDFSLMVGDYLTDARKDTWDQECFGPAKDFFAAVPCFAVAGNHDLVPDQKGHSSVSPVFTHMFQSASGTSNWTAQIGPIFLIGINGRLKFDEDDIDRKWLDDALNQSAKSPYVFLLSHYPGWSSTKYGLVDQYGLLDRDVQRAREFILPLLVKHHVTAMLCGHAHGYERCELPGIMTITSAGGGAPLARELNDPKKFNPWSKAFVHAYNYVILKIDGPTCSVKAYDLDGKVIDECELKARPQP